MKTINQNIIITTIILACALGLSIVYAATTGLLSFSGTAFVSTNAEAIFVELELDAFATNPQSSFTVSADQKTVEILAHVDLIDNACVLSAKVENVGTVPITLNSIDILEDLPPGLSFIPPTFITGLRLEPGEVSYPFPVRIVMQQTFSPPTPPGSYPFHMVINYSEAP